MSLDGTAVYEVAYQVRMLINLLFSASLGLIAILIIKNTVNSNKSPQKNINIILIVKTIIIQITANVIISTIVAFNYTFYK